MADHFGRKIPIAVGCLIMILGACLSAFTDGYGSTFLKTLYGRGLMFSCRCMLTLLSRQCTSVAASWSVSATPLPSCPALSSSPRFATLSTVVLSLPFTTVYGTWEPQVRYRMLKAQELKMTNIGDIVCAFIGLGTINISNDWSWRSITLIQGVPSLIQLTFLWWIPESPRWLMAKERHDQALDILAKYHANGDKDNATVQFEYKEIKDTIGLEYQTKKNGSYLDFIRTPGNRHRLLLLISLGIISQYSGNALISNYSNLIYEGAGITDQAAKTGLNAGENMLKLFVAIGCSCGIDKFGRRPLFLTATVGK